MQRGSARKSASPFGDIFKCNLVPYQRLSAKICGDYLPK
jgi:hypothetical protein